MLAVDVPTESYTHPTIGDCQTTQLACAAVNSDTLRNTAIACGALVVIAIVLRLSMRSDRPGGLQNLLEWFADSLRSLIAQTLGDRPIQIAPIAITMFAFILVCNMLGLVPGLKSPTNDVNTALALALFTIGLLHFQSVRFRGPTGYVSHYFSVVTPRWTAGFGFGAVFRVLFALIEIIIEIAKPFTLAFRLYFNIFVGELMLAIILALLSFAAPVAGGAWIFFAIFVGIIQAFIFTMLTLAYVAQGTETHSAGDDGSHDTAVAH